MKKRIKKITLCSSASFFGQLFPIAVELKKLGFKVVFPITAIRMRRNKDFRVKRYKTWFKDPSHYNLKSRLIRGHFRKIISSDAILVVNGTRKGISGYIGGATLLEMGIAFHYKKPIYLLNSVSDKLSLKEEILGMQPIFLNGDLRKMAE